MSTPTYPGDRNNEPKENLEPTRDLSIINQPAGGLEFVNTRDDEMVTFYHKNGSYVRMHKFANDTLNTLDKREHTQGDCRLEVNGNQININHKDVEDINLGDKLIKIGDVDHWQQYLVDYKKLSREIHDIKRLFELKRVKVHNFIDQAPEQTKSGALVECPAETIKSKILYTVAPTVYIPAIKKPCEHVSPGIIENECKYHTIGGSGGKMYEEGWECFTCWGTGDSPSSQDGEWSKEGLKDKITQKRIDIQEKMFDLEKKWGMNQHREGGSKIEKISKDYVGVVGLAFNDFESFRKDPKGKLVPYGVKIDPFGTGVYTQYRESSLVEHVHVDRLPGGSYSLTVSDGYELIVGSNGINMKTSGPMEMYAPIIDITSENINLHSRGELALGGERVDISAEIITLRPKKVKREIEDASGSPIGSLPANEMDKTEEENPVLIDGNLNVTGNSIIKGGMHVEGELSVHHITAPCEYHITDECFEWGKQENCAIDEENNNDPCQEPVQSTVYADIVPGCLIGLAICPDGVCPVISLCSPNSVKVHPHFHYYKTLPMKLIRDNIEVEITVGGKTDTKTVDPHGAVRVVGARNNFSKPVLAKPVKNSISRTTVLEKFTGSVCDPLVIENGNWEESNEADTLPEGEGVRTSNYTDEKIFERVKELEEKLTERYKELQKKIDELEKAKQ